MGTRDSDLLGSTTGAVNRAPDPGR